MKHLGSAAFAALCLASTVIVGPGLERRVAASPAQETAPQTESDRDAFVGTYKLVSIVRSKADGEVVSTTTDSLGLIMYGPTGRMAVQIMPSGRPTEAGSFAEMTPDEALASFRGYTAYYGTYTVNESDKTVLHRRESNLNSRADRNARRSYEFSGNQVTLTPPPTRVDGEQITTRLTWERLPPTAQTTVEQRFRGFRRLVAIERTIEKPGEEPTVERDTSRTGLIVYTPTGHMAVQIARPGRSRFARATPTAAEAKAALETYSAYFGPFTVHETSGFVVHHRHGQLNPGLVGTHARRFYELNDNLLTLQPPPTTNDAGETITTRLTWERFDES